MKKTKLREPAITTYFSTICSNCGKTRGDHRTVEFGVTQCPAGLRTRIGYLRHGPGTFVPKQTLKE